MIEKLRQVIADKKTVKICIRRYMFVLTTNEMCESTRNGEPQEYFVAGELDEVMFHIRDVDEIGEMNGKSCIFLK
ncbi:MAG: hypothetical protein WC661_17450 [Opitutaceae bacterium]|jgi:hypothetical protein